MKNSAGFFLEEDSEECQRIRKTLISGQFRCNLMMVTNAEQAAAMLRHECEAAAPDLLLIYGGLHDGRAAALLENLARDSRLSTIRYPVLVDTLQARREFRQDPRSKDAPLSDFRCDTLDQRLAGDGQAFWWVMARFS